MMASIPGKDTGPELQLRRALHSAGYRFRLHADHLPGRPDVCFPQRKKAVFVHGCFWHQHDCALGAKKPRTNIEYWHPKLARNVERDQDAQRELAAIGWSAFVVWECELKELGSAIKTVKAFLGPPRRER